MEMRSQWSVIGVWLIIWGVLILTGAVDRTTCLAVMGRPFQETEDPQEEIFSADEQRLIDLVAEFQAAQEKYWEGVAAIKDGEEQLKFLRENEPAREYLPKLLAMEEEFRGQDIGFAALMAVESVTGKGFFIDYANNQVRPESIRRMRYYVEHPLFPYLLTSFASGTANGNLEKPIRQLVEQIPKGSSNYWWAQYYLGEYLVTYREIRQHVVAIQPYPEEETEKILATLPSEEQTARNAVEGEQIFEMLAALNRSEHRLPKIKARGDSRIFIQLDSDADAQTNVSVAERAAGALFRERYAKQGSPMPPLQVNLIDGRPWALQDHVGKVVILMFSFKGCGPCERTYPILRTLQERYPDTVEILSIMNDAEMKTTRDSVAEGTLTWNVCWDGDRGPTTMAWGVTGFPTIYVYDKRGKNAGPLGVQNLEKWVEELLEQSE